MIFVMLSNDSCRFCESFVFIPFWIFQLHVVQHCPGSTTDLGINSNCKGDGRNLPCYHKCLQCAFISVSHKVRRSFNINSLHFKATCLHILKFPQRTLWLFSPTRNLPLVLLNKEKQEGVFWISREDICYRLYTLPFNEILESKSLILPVKLLLNESHSLKQSRET